MKDQSNFQVAVIKGNTPETSVFEGIKMLGGISNFINEGDNVFIKFNLYSPEGFPTNTNFDILGAVINLCKEAGANKISIGSFPAFKVPIKAISDLLRIEKYFNTLGAEFVFLDNSNLYGKKEFTIEELKIIKSKSLSKVKVNDKEFLVPRVILESDKFISVNQVNVNPLFKLNFSLLNSYSMISTYNQEIEKTTENKSEYVSLDKYKQELKTKIIDVFTIKQPKLVINDLFYILEGAGPFIYKDSNLKKTEYLVIGNNSIATDIITLKMLNLELEDCDLILDARNKISYELKPSEIKTIGVDLKDIDINIEFCATKLEDIDVSNVSIRSGRYCSGCFKQAYHLLNFMKTKMIKDLKYNPRNSFLIGENPPNPNNPKNIILFGDCAINSTKESDFRKVIKKSKKSIKNDVNKKNNNKSKANKEGKIKLKKNEKILELEGCPPDIFSCIDFMIKYYGKINVPNLCLFNKTIKLWSNRSIREKLDIWEAF